MTKITTTFAKCHAAGACPAGYRKMAKALGGIKEYGRDKPVSIRKALSVLGSDDARWVLGRASGWDGRMVRKVLSGDFYQNIFNLQRMTDAQQRKWWAARIRHHLKEAGS